MTPREIEIYERELKKLTDDLLTVNPKPAETLKSNKHKFNMEPYNMEQNKKNGLTWKAVITLIFISVAQAVLSLFFDDQTTSKFIEVLKTVLESLGYIAAGAAAWGIRRAI